MTLAVAVAALLAGVLIGLTGIGGVLVAPALTEFAAVPLERAIAASLLGFLIAGPMAGYLIGDWLARKLGWGWLTWFVTLLGFAAAGRQIYLIARRIQREQEQPPPD